MNESDLFESVESLWKMRRPAQPLPPDLGARQKHQHAKNVKAARRAKSKREKAHNEKMRARRK